MKKNAMLDHLIELLNSAFRRSNADTSSKEAARQRLQLVLMQDRSTLSNETLEAMKNEIIEVISRYLAIDKEGVEVHVERSDGAVTLVSNIPVRNAPKDIVEAVAEAKQPNS